MLVIDEPTRVRLTETNLDLVKAQLTYIDKSVEYQIRRLKQARWFDPEAHAEKLQELKEQQKPCLLQEDENGYFTLSGLADEISRITHEPIDRRIVYPPCDTIPWHKVPPELRPYQEETVSLFLERKHAAAELATGLGKSFIILHLVKRIGLKSVVMAPTTSIADQLYDDFITYLGKARVGRFYGGKKDTNKLVTIAIHASLAKIDRSSDEYDALSMARVFVADESHLTPATTLRSVCTGLLRSAPYRFFLSGKIGRAHV